MMCRIFFRTVINCSRVNGWLLVTFLAISRFAQAQPDQYNQRWNNPAVQQRMDSGIREHRMGDAVLRITDKAGKPVKNATVQVKQTRHAFLFGSNLFMLNGFKTDTLNRRYEEAFLTLFNHGSIPFYWKTLEPEPGKIRFAADSKPVYRRPPPDAVLAFCEKNNIYPKGHTLVWDNPQWAVPDWLPADESAIQLLIDTRIGQIGERYGQRIKMWDVVNEIRNRHMQVAMPRDFANQAFKKAADVFPNESILMINETTSVWYDRKREYSQYYQVIENLLLKGARIDAIGLQCHFFHGEQEFQDVLAGNIMRPTEMFDVMDTYASFGKPLHITEVTIPTIPDTPEGRKFQATVARNLYRIWFSHPTVESIVWWNIADGTAAPGEDKWRGGFLDENLALKPSFDVLNKLINSEWKTNMETKAINGEAKFRGFYGDYEITVRRGGKTVKQNISLKKGGDTTFVIQMLAL